jgi:hypothetical protein
MPTNQQNPIESPTVTLDLLHLMRDLEVLGAELQISDNAIGRQNLAHQDPVTDRLTRAGVSIQKVKDFNAWERTISGLIASNPRDEDHLAKIAAAEKAGLTLREELIGELRNRNQKRRVTDTLPKNLAA